MNTVRMAPPVFHIDPLAPPNVNQDALAQSAAIVTAGGLVVFPTQCLYGLGANAFNAAAVERLYDLKQRDTSKPVLILIGPHHNLQHLVTNIPPAAAALMAAFWPGSLTLVMQASSRLPAVLTAGTDSIGIRMAGHEVARRLLACLPHPLTGTSANLSGEPGCFQIEKLSPAIRKGVDAILNAGTLKGGNGSTVVDVRTSDIQILREGVVSAAAIARVLAS